MLQKRRFVSLIVAMDNIRCALYGLERAMGQRSPAVEVQRHDDELRQAREAYQRLVRTSPGIGRCFGAVTRNAESDEVGGMGAALDAWDDVVGGQVVHRAARAACPVATNHELGERATPAAG